MLSKLCFICIIFGLMLGFSITTINAKLHHKNPTNLKHKNPTTICVDPSGRNGCFRTIQAAIDSIPSNNRGWIRISVKKGVYREQVKIPTDKPYIYLKGDGKERTHVVWDANDSIATSATFTSLADHTIAKGISFVNSYNYPPNATQNQRKPAVAALIEGEKSAFHDCGFYGLQDTLWDCKGRHYFKHCTIEGAVDFIFGAGQSQYEECNISVVAEVLHGFTGYITAQGRSSAEETNGFVFKSCNIVGHGKTFLGRPWRDHARVLFHNTFMSDVVVPQGWGPWSNLEDESQLTFAEDNCHGPGSDTSRRVKWAKTLSTKKLQQFISTSFIDKEGWMKKLPLDFLGD